MFNSDDIRVEPIRDGPAGSRERYSYDSDPIVREIAEHIHTEDQGKYGEFTHKVHLELADVPSIKPAMTFIPLDSEVGAPFDRTKAVTAV